MNDKYLEIDSVKYILNLRTQIIEDRYIKKNETKYINDFFNESLLYISFFGVNSIRITINILINFILDNFMDELKKCDPNLVIQFIKILNYYPHLIKIGLPDDNMDIIDFLNIELRTYNGKILTDKQIELYKNIISKNQVIYSAPTSYGKTMICMEGFIELFNIDKVNNLLIIVPTKSLINEYKKNIQGYIKKHMLDLNIIESAYTEFKPNKKNIYIFTQERVLSFFNNNERIKSINYILVDEAQSIASIKNKRTPLLLKALSLFDDCPKIYLTPFVKNFNENVVKRLDNKNKFSEVVVNGNESLVANNKFIIDLYNNDKIKMIDVTFDKYDEIFEFDRKYDKSNNNSDFLNVLPIINNKEECEDKNIIFCSSINKSIDWPKFITKIKSCKNNRSKRMMALIKHLEKNIHKSFDLIDYLKNGVAYHNSYLDSFTKRQIEYIFTEEEGIKYLFCTNTISQGINFSAKNIFVFVKKIISDNPDLDFINLLGRAARLKYNSLGNLYYVKTSKESKYEKLFLNSNNNLNINLYKISSSDIEKKENITLRSYLADSKIINLEKEKILNENKEIINNLNLKFGEVEQMNYSIEQSDIEKIEKKIRCLSSEKINEFLKFYQSYSITYEFISFLCETYEWKKIYGNDKKKRRILNLEFVSTIITKLIQGQTINNIVNYNIERDKYQRLYIDTELKTVSYDGKNGGELFDIKNKSHINILIINSLFDVQTIIEFDVKKYIQDFYYRVNKIHNVEYKDVNLENFIDFTTVENKKIKLINLGIVDSFAINEIVSKKEYSDIISKDKIDLQELLNKIYEVNGDESPLYYSIKDIIG